MKLSKEGKELLDLEINDFCERIGPSYSRVHFKKAVKGKRNQEEINEALRDTYEEFLSAVSYNIANFYESRYRAENIPLEDSDIAEIEKVIAHRLVNNTLDLKITSIPAIAEVSWMDAIRTKINNQKSRLEINSKRAALSSFRPSIDIFISHSSQDLDIAESLIRLLRAALNITPVRIRCTSVNGYRLPVGASTEEQLRKEVHEAKIFVGLITPASLQSAYVLFELGARWGAGLHLAPVLASGADVGILRGPLAGLNALTAADSSQVHQLISDIASLLNLEPNPVSSYQKEIDVLVDKSRRRPSDFVTENRQTKNGASSKLDDPTMRERERKTIADIAHYIGLLPIGQGGYLIYYYTVDKELGMSEGTAKAYIEEAALDLGYEIERKGKDTILLRNPKRRT